MRAKLCQVVTFAGHVFSGNPAYVMILDAVPDPAAMAGACSLLGADVLAVITGLAGSVPALHFFTPSGPHPGAGHATLAAAHVAMAQRGRNQKELPFNLADGGLRVCRLDSHGIAVDWPRMAYETTARHAEIAAALGVLPLECFVSEFGYIAVLQSEGDVASLQPDLLRVAELDRNTLIVTAKGLASDIVIRVFAPRVGLPEDPVCGTAHRIIVPYWSDLLGKAAMHSRHLSARGGDLWCTVNGGTVTIAGASITAFEGTLHLPD